MLELVSTNISLIPKLVNPLVEDLNSRVRKMIKIEFSN